MINTKKVTDRRVLRFESLNEAVLDAESLAAAEREGRLRHTGNWELGQTIGHVAFWANAPFEGYPEMGKIPWPVKLILKAMKNGLLNKKLPAGGRIPRVPAGTFGVDKMPTDMAVGKLRAAFDRLASQCPAVDNPMFGPMTHEEWIKLNLRHAELHLSFFHPGH